MPLLWRGSRQTQPPAATIGAGLVLGWRLLISGIIETVHAFQVRRWGGFFLHLIGGVLEVLTGLLVITHPLAGAVAWTLLFASFLAAMGLFRLVAAFSLSLPHWGWAVVDGIVSLALGILLWAEWPSSGCGFWVCRWGISLILRGWSYVMIATALRNRPGPVQVGPA